MSLAASLSFDHQCSVPPASGSSRRWFCPDCGTLWIFVRKMVGRRPVADWRPVSRTGETEVLRLRRQVDAVRQYLSSGTVPEFYAREIDRRMKEAE